MVIIMNTIYVVNQIG